MGLALDFTVMVLAVRMMALMIPKLPKYMKIIPDAIDETQKTWRAHKFGLISS